MKTLYPPDHLVLVPERDDEQTALMAWRAAHDGHVFALMPNAGSGAGLISLGPRDEACREPINVTSMSPDPIRLIANFAPAPFWLDGARYACVEAFWQSLRFPLDQRSRIAAMDGARAKHESEQQPYGAFMVYGGREIPVGTYEHWQLMRRACKAKFEQNADARCAAGYRRAAARSHRETRQPHHSGRHHGGHLDAATDNPASFGLHECRQRIRPF